MNRFSLYSSVVWALLLCLSAGAGVPRGLSTPVSSDRVLEREAAERIEIRHSMLGYRDTLVFYLFKEQQAVLVISIGSLDELFPVTGTIHLFDSGVTEEDIKKWVNNQHSDGLFAVVPSPFFVKELPEEFCRVVSRKQIGTSKNPGPGEGIYKDFLVKLEVEAQHVQGHFKMTGFIDTARVHARIK